MWVVLRHLGLPYRSREHLEWEEWERRLSASRGMRMNDREAIQWQQENMGMYKNDREDLSKRIYDRFTIELARQRREENAMYREDHKENAWDYWDQFIECGSYQLTLRSPR